MYSTSPHHPLSRTEIEEGKPKSWHSLSHATAVLSEEVRMAIRSNLVSTLFPRDYDAQLLAFLFKTGVKMETGEIQTLERAYKRTLTSKASV